MSGKKRLDILLVEKKLVQSRQRARSLIMAGKVMVNHVPSDKPGTLCNVQADITLKAADHPYASRGGLKLASALKENNVNCMDLVCLDVGASTGGFTDCLLQQHAKKVYAVDVGYGQLAWKLRNDPRVVVIERTNIRHMDPDLIKDTIDLVVIDVSFISLKIVVPYIIQYLAHNGIIIALIKPQFEVGKGRVGKGGVVKDPDLHQSVIDDLTRFFEENSLSCGRVVPSPVLGPKGNREFTILLQKALPLP